MTHSFRWRIHGDRTASSTRSDKKRSSQGKMINHITIIITIVIIIVTITIIITITTINFIITIITINIILIIVRFRPFSERPLVYKLCALGLLFSLTLCIAS